MSDDRWWYKTKDRLERVLDDLFLVFALVMSGVLAICMCAVAMIAFYVLGALLLELL